MLQATVVVPYPGTALNRFAHEHDLFRFDPKDYDRYDMTEPVLKTPDMAPQEVMKMCEGVYRSFLSPRFVLRHLRGIRSLEDARYIAKGAIAVLGHLKDFGADRADALSNKDTDP